MKYVRNVPTAMATWAASGRAGRAHHGGDCFLRGSRSVDDRANFVLSIPAHRGFPGWRRRHMSLIGEFKTTIHNCTARLSKAIGEVGSSIGWIRVRTKAWGIIDDMSTRPRRAAAPPKFLSCSSSQADRFQPGTSISGINLPGAGGPTVRQSSFLGGARTRVFGLNVLSSVVGLICNSTQAGTSGQTPPRRVPDVWC